MYKTPTNTKQKQTPTNTINHKHHTLNIRPVLPADHRQTSPKRSTANVPSPRRLRAPWPKDWPRPTEIIFRQVKQQNVLLLVFRLVFFIGGYLIVFESFKLDCRIALLGTSSSKLVWWSRSWAGSSLHLDKTRTSGV